MKNVRKRFLCCWVPLFTIPIPHVFLQLDFNSKCRQNASSSNFLILNKGNSRTFNFDRVPYNKVQCNARLLHPPVKNLLND